MTHITDVKPLVTVVTYTDVENGYEVYQEVTGRTFAPIETSGGCCGVLCLDCVVVWCV